MAFNSMLRTLRGRPAGGVGESAGTEAPVVEVPVAIFSKDDLF